MSSTKLAALTMAPSLAQVATGGGMGPSTGSGGGGSLGGSRGGSKAGSRAQSFSASHQHMNKATVTSTPLPPVTLKIEAAKRLAAYAAVDEHVKPEHRVIGIGSGTTVPYVVERIVQQGEDLNADVRRALRHLQHSFPLVRTLRLRGKLSG